MVKKGKGGPKAKAAAKSPGKPAVKSAAVPVAPAKGRVRYWDENVPEQFVFFVRDGKVVKNLKELVAALDKMADDVFHHHANREKNDFSNWIRDVMQHHDLAHNILGKNKHGTKETIMIYVKRKTGRNVA